MTSISGYNGVDSSRPTLYREKLDKLNEIEKTCSRP